MYEALRLSSAVELVHANLPIQGVPVDAEHLCSSGLVAFRLAKCGLYESLFEFVPGLPKKYAAVDHFGDEGFQLLFHNIVPTKLQVLAPPSLNFLITDQELRLQLERRNDGYNSGSRKKVRR